MVFANISGGRDSVAMTVRSLELGEQIDYLIFCDTGLEFPEMYQYMDNLNEYLKRNFNKSLTIIDKSKIIEEWAFEKTITRGANIGRLRGIPKIIGHDFCTREAKAIPSKNFIKSLSPNRFKTTVLVGYTANEVKRGRVSNFDYATARYPLHEWGWNEAEVTEFLKSRGIMNTLYKHFNRTGCYICPKQSKQSLYNLYLNYPKQWEIMKNWEAKAKELNCINQSFKIDKTLEQLEQEFNNQSKPLFDNEDIDLTDSCFCKA